MAWLREIKGNWYLYHRIDGVEQKPIPCGKSYSVANDTMRTLKERLKLGVDAGRVITVGQLWKDYQAYSESTKAPETVRHIKAHLPKFVNRYTAFPLSTFTPGRIEQYKDSLLTEKYEVNGVNIKLVALRAFFQFAADREYILRNPAKKVKNLEAVKVGRALTPEEFGILLKKGCLMRKLREVVVFAVYTGLRLGELVKLKKEHVQGYYAHIQKVRKGKKREKVVPIPKPVRYIVDRVKRGPIFGTWTENRIQQNFRAAVKRAQKNSKGKFSERVRFHDLRHTAATWGLTRSKLRLEEVQELLGHTSIKTTKDTYGHLEKERLMERVQDLDYDI